MSPKKLYFSAVFPTNLSFNSFLFNIIVRKRLFYLFDTCIMRKQQMLSCEKESLSLIINILRVSKATYPKTLIKCPLALFFLKQ